MAKVIELGLDKYQAADFARPVRAKSDVILIWMQAIKALIASFPPAEADIQAKLSIVVISMSRLFFETTDRRKIFSVAFPFSVREEEDGVCFYSREGIKMDSRVTSQIVGLVTGAQVFEEKDFGRFLDPIFDAADLDPSLWTLLRELMLAEDGYVRYDWDEVRANRHLHPLHHLDFFYTPSGSFKLGLGATLDRDQFVHLMNVETDCMYVRPAE